MWPRLFTLRSLLGLLPVLALVVYYILRTKYIHALIWYLIFFKFFFKHVQILHPLRTKFKMTEKDEKYSHHLIAHRGGGWHAPENTLQAFKQAVDIGCHMLEMDVRITKDKRIIVCHDEDLNRLCCDNRKVFEVDFEKLPSFK